jgi:hypothetical protein
MKPLAKMNSILLVLALVASHKWEVHQMDVKSARKKSKWNNLLAMSRMTLALFVALRNLFMVSSKLPELGMPKWKIFLLPLDSLDAIMILMSIPRK